MLIKKTIDSQFPINSLIGSRWSGRAYNRDREVTEEQILQILEAARWAPSCHGEEPWRYMVCNSHKDSDAWERALNCLTEGNQSWARNTPVLILVLANKTFSHNGEENRWAEYDTGAASMNICLQATELGLMVHQMGGMYADKVTESFSIPETFRPMAIMAVGYQLSEDCIPENMLERELSERKRKPFDDLFFSGQWGNTFSP